MNELIYENTKSPDISFGSINVVDEAFRAHVDWTAYSNVFEAGGSFDGEAKISNFINALFDKNIG